MAVRTRYWAGVVSSSLGIAAVAAASACGVDTFGTMEVPSPLPDPPPSSAVPQGPEGPGAGAVDADAGDGVDAASSPAPTTTADGGVTVPPVVTPLCPAGTARCAATNACVRECAKDCPTAPVGCFACAPVTNVPSAAQCVPAATPAACVAAPHVRCGCAGGKASSCPGPQNVCVGNVCVACGEPGSAGLACKDPADKACSDDPKGKPDEAFTCH